MTEPTINAVAAVALYAIGLATGCFVGFWVGRVVEWHRDREEGRP